MEICGTIDIVRGNQIKIAPLQISQQNWDIEESDRFGQFRSRKTVSKYFSENHHGDISYDQLFKEAKIFAEIHSIAATTLEEQTKHAI